MAQVSRATHASSVATKLADNSAGDISEQDLREVITDLEDSVTWYDEADIVNDTTPQLGGNLDVNGNKIVSTSNGNIDIEPNGTGNVLLGNFVIDADATIGASQDNYVLTYDHAAGTWGPEAASGGGGGGGFTQEQVEDIVADMFVGGTQSHGRVTFTYDDTNGEIDVNVENTLSSFTNDAGFLTDASVKTLTNTTIDANGTGNSITNIETADLATSAKTGLDTKVVTGTAGTSGNLASWNADGDAVDSGVAASAVLTSVSTANITDESVTLAKLQHIATDSFLARDTAGTGDVEVVGASAARTILNVEDGSTANPTAPESDPSGVTGADAITNMMSLTQAEYDAIGTPDASTFYLITG